MGKFVFNDLAQLPMGSKLFYRIWISFFLVAVACRALPSKSDVPQGIIRNNAIYAIKNVNIIPMTLKNEVIYNATVVIRDNRIESINGQIPAGVEVIQGKGKWLVPGFIDMHVHVPTDFYVGTKLPTQDASVFFDTQDLVTPYVANGVTTIFNLNASFGSFSQRNAIARGNVIGPRMALAALIDGGQGIGRKVNTATDGRQAVRSAKAEGYEFIKVYSGLNVETYKAIIDEAHAQGLKTIGHIPDAFQGKLKQAFVPYYGMVAHAEEFTKHSKDFSEEDAQRFAILAKENGTWLTPTLTALSWISSQVRSIDELRTSPTLQYVHPLLQSKWLTANNYHQDTTSERRDYFKKMVDFNKKLVRAFKLAGVPIVTGTDTGVSGVVAGFSLHHEMEQLVEAGLTPEEVLSSATRLPAIWLGLESEIGTVEKGKRADLVLLDSNPLEDVKNARRISGVVVNGQWIDKSSISKMLSELSKRNTAAKDKYDWNKLMGK
ncbi:amidohydrolase family protein [Dyadobacter arcticus]|uniref:Imidazolonepropionase-like amidohydrolase n=1 Tax=Dyadobacter arcticus TaxID=1078754 RepID=A0ABX0UIW4_9BACT|nr:amidohydrolase family protein [Dyadobacter arcticus]NIJ52958.1 imidazolonepropionase-like amidohydrolase [Dyadobacter arcticus]